MIPHVLAGLLAIGALYLVLDYDGQLSRGVRQLASALHRSACRRGGSGHVAHLPLPGPLPAANPPTPQAVTTHPIPELGSMAVSSQPERSLLARTWSALFALPESTDSRYLRASNDDHMLRKLRACVEEAQAMRHRMELREIQHRSSLEAAVANAVSSRLQREEVAVDHARKRAEECADHARHRAESDADHARRRAEADEDHVRRRAELLDDQAYARRRVVQVQHEQEDDAPVQRAWTLEDRTLARERAIASAKFSLETLAHARDVARETWRMQADVRARSRTEAIEAKRAAKEHRKEATRWERQRERRAVRTAACARRDAAASRARKQRADERKWRAELALERERLHLQLEERTQRDRRERTIAKERAARERLASAQAEERARAAQAAADAAARERAVDEEYARQRKHELAAIAHDVALAKRRAHLRDKNLPSDPAQLALKKDCARIALDVSTGTVLVNEQNCYHGFAAIKFREYRRTLSRPEAEKATARALFLRRWEQPPITLAEAQMFAAQYAAQVDAEHEQAALAQATDVLSRMTLGTKDRYGRNEEAPSVVPGN